MRRTTIASVIACLGAGSGVQAQTILWGETTTQLPREQPGTVYQAPVYVAPGQAQPVQNPPIYYDTQPRAPEPVYIDPQPTYQLPTAPQAPAPTPSWQVTPQIPQPQIPQQQFPAQPEPAFTAEPAAPVRPVEPPGPPPAAHSARPDAVREFASELDALITLAERYRAASPGFIEDLKDLAAKYETLPLETIAAAIPPVAEDPVPDETVETAADASLFGGQDAETTDTPPVEVAASGASDAPVVTTDQPDGTELAMATPETLETVEPAPQAEEPVTELPGDLPPTSAAIVYLRDDFSDGDFTASPTWTVRQGEWQVDPVYGLRARFEPDRNAAPITPSDLLQHLLGDDAPAADAEPSSVAALIEAETGLGNAFSLVANVTDHAGEGAVHFIVHQGGANWLGYRLELRSGVRPLVVLTRRGASGYKDIMKVEAPGLSTGKSHQLRWARLSDGQMFVLIDGKPVITARDTVFQQGWTGFGYFVAGGDVSLRNIRIAEPVEQ